MPAEFESALSAVPAPPVPHAVRQFRERYRAAHIGSHYNGYLHLACTLTVTTSIALGCISTLHAPSWRQSLVPLLGFVGSNLVEYLAHRFLMHRPMFPRVLYTRHTLEHHHFYTHEAMAPESVRDFQMILFPVAMLLVLLALADIPLALVAYLLAGANVAKLLAATTIGYYAMYECLHTAYHMPDTHWVARLPGVKRLRRLHTSHHNLANMGRYNFNVTLPLFDCLFGSYKREWSREQ